MRLLMDIYIRNFKKLVKHTQIGLFSLILAGVPATLALAADENTEIPWYEVEVIIFANQQKLAADTETWPEGVTTAGYDHVLDLALPGFTPLKPNLPPINTKASLRTASVDEGDVYGNGAYVLLDKDFFQLTNIARRIDSSSKYDVVLHLAWRQPTFDEDKSLPVFVFNGMTERDPTPEPVSNAGLQQGYDFYVNGLQAGPQYHWLSGTLKLSVSRYLHMEADLHMKLRKTKQEIIEESPPPESGGFGSFFGVNREPTPIMIERPVVQDYRLFETRRMRSKEIHYFDHPLMGIVVKVTPYEFDVPTPEPQPGTPQPQ